MITGVRESLKGFLGSAQEQLKNNRELKHQLEMDWSDKACHNV